MDERLENYLKENYPQIIPENFYFECGDGWFLILNAAFDRMMKTKDKTRFENDPYPRVAQIKEKFGTMRLYIDSLDAGREYWDAINSIVTMAETLSSRTCESCGRAGFPHDAGWMKVYCKWCQTDGRPTFNQEWVNACVEMIEDEKEYNREYKDWMDDND